METSAWWYAIRINKIISADLAILNLTESSETVFFIGAVNTEVFIYLVDSYDFCEQPTYILWNLAFQVLRNYIVLDTYFVPTGK